MFTGLVCEVGQVVSFEDGRLVVAAATDAAPGDSVAIDGVCLTVVERDHDGFTADVMRETLDKTSLGGLAPGDRVNLERAVTPQTRLGGHQVQGHVDGVGRVAAAEPEGDGARVRIEAPPELLRYCVEKGSITVDGVSLTVAAVDGSGFEVALVPHTLAATTLSELAPGSPVNLETDVLAKYVEKLLPGTMAR